MASRRLRKRGGRVGPVLLAKRRGALVADPASDTAAAVLRASTVALCLAIACLGGWRPRSASADESLTIAGGIAVHYPADWSALSTPDPDAWELVQVPADEPDGAAVLRAPRIVVSSEHRSDHAHAVDRLREVATEVAAPARFLNICGWPALQRRHTETAPRPGLPSSADDAEARIIRIATVVAVGDRVVRLEGRVATTAAPEIVDAIEAIGRSLTCAAPADPGRTESEIADLRRGASRAPLPGAGPAAIAAAAPAGAAAAPPGSAPRLAVSGNNPSSEMEVAVSNDGQFVVVAAQNQYARSTDGGQTFAAQRTLATANFGDSSLTFGLSGTFYYGFINRTAGCTPGAGCSTGIAVSTNNGSTFALRSNAVVCPATGMNTCFPDQEHVAADRFTAAAVGGGDLVYSVWRNFPGPNPMIVCSADGGTTWPQTRLIGSGDFPRVTVAQDGFVYVAYLNGNNVMLDKYSNCDNGPGGRLVRQMNFPVTVGAFTNVTCPMPGLDRCNSGNSLSSPTVAVDDTNANHVFVAYATNTANNSNENVVVRDSTNGGATFPTTVTVNSNVTGRRFMPWLCSVGGAARVSWYDRRNAVGGASNDLTDLYCGSAARNGAGMLVAGAETRVTQASDPQCAAGAAGGNGWPCVPRNTQDSESCTVQPQNAGVCCNTGQMGCPGSCPGAMCPGSGQRCDFNQGPACPTPGETCNADPAAGCPKYGDFNGNACGVGRVFTAWASAVPPPGLVGSGGIDVYLSTKLAGSGPDLAVSMSDAPDPVVAGTDLSLTINVTNSGPASAFQVVVSDTVPPNTTYRSISAPGFACLTPAPGGTGTITCTRAFMAPSETTAITLVVRVDASSPDGSTITDTATVASADPDSNPANDTATTVTTVITRADLSISKLGMPNPVVAGTQLTYALTATNLGPSDAQTVTIGDALPAATRFLSATPSAGGSCAVPPVDGAGSVQCTFAGATTPNGAHSVMITVRVCADALCGNPITDTGTTASATTDPNPANNMASVASAVQSQSDLSITKIGPGTVSWGQVIQFVLKVRNAGVSTSHDTTVVDAVPSAFLVLKAVPSQGTCAVSANTVTCNLGDLGAANQCAGFPDHARVVISVRVRPVPPGPVDNTATVSSGNCLPDPNPDDNSASATTFVTATAPGSGDTRNLPAPLLSPLAIVVLALAVGALAIRRLMRRAPPDRHGAAVGRRGD